MLRNKTKLMSYIHEFDGKLFVIKTYPVYPPIPVRDRDWAAYYENEEELGHYGWGSTEDAAAQDLIDNYDPKNES
jgi:hypothetical protein